MRYRGETRMRKQRFKSSPAKRELVGSVVVARRIFLGC